jgi:hypothetical protein
MKININLTVITNAAMPQDAIPELSRAISDYFYELIKIFENTKYLVVTAKL